MFRLPELASAALRTFRKKAYHHREYSIGMLAGPTPLSLAEVTQCNPVLTRRSVTDVRAAFVADPFMMRADDGWHMFLEVLAVRPSSRKGEIGHATSRDGLRWSYQGIVLQEPFHLSYPHVFQDGAQTWLVPESTAAGGIRLYRADPFPSRWSFVKTLVEGDLVDSSIFRRAGRWWMFSHSAEPDRSRSLRLYGADDLSGPWIEHPRSPIVRHDKRLARPAGRVVELGDRLLRFAQDGLEGYGMHVHALEILRLTPDDYEEVECAGNPLLTGSGRGWNGGGMHHLDVHRREDGSWLGCTDGWSPRICRP